MGNKSDIPHVTLDASKATEIVTIASRAQAQKVHEVMNRIDVIAKLDQDSLAGVVATLGAVTSDGGCGIGCW